MDVLTRKSLAFAALLCTACAVPGPPRPREPRALSCPGIEARALTDEGLRLDFLLPPPASASPHEFLVLYRAVGDAELQFYQEIDLLELVPEAAYAGGRLPFLEVELHRDREVRYALGVIPMMDMRCAPQRHVLEVRVPSVSSSPPPAPEVEVRGQTVRIEARGAGPWRLYRRDVRQRDVPPVLVVLDWSGKAYVDGDVEPGHVYAYAVMRAYPVESSAGVVEVLTGPRGPEAYAPVAP